MAIPAPKPYLVARDGAPDLSFTGWSLGEETSGWPEVRLFKSQTGKYIVDERDIDDDGRQTASAVILNGLEAVVKYIIERYGEYSDEAKAVFRQASAIEPSLSKYAVEEV